MSEKLLSIKEIAAELGRGRNYVGAMVSQGFSMPGGRATLTEAREWLKKHPKPRARCIAVRRGASAALVLRRIAA